VLSWLAVHPDSFTHLFHLWDCSQDNQGAWGWTLPKEDYDALSSKKFQLKYFDGGFVMDKEGPYKNYEDLWNEPQP